MYSPPLHIILPCYNCADTVEETLISVRNQAFTEFRCFMVDDCSTDETPNILLNFQDIDPRFVYLRLPSNQGVSAARNFALTHCSGTYISFLDSDDIWHPEFLSRGVSLLEEGVDFVYCPVLRFFDTDTRPSFFKNSPSSVTLRSLLTNNHIPLSSVIFRASLLSCSAKFGLQRPEDYIFWINLFMANPSLRAYRFSRDPYLFYRVSASQRSSNKFINIKRVYSVYRKCWKFSPLVCVLFCFIYVLNSLSDYFFQYLSPRPYPFNLSG